MFSNADMSPIAQQEQSRTQQRFDVPWQTREVALALAVAVALTIGLPLVVIGSSALLLRVTGLGPPPRALAILAVLSELALLVPVWLFGVRRHGLTWASIGFRRFDASRGLGLGCLFLLMAFAANSCWALAAALLRQPARQDVSRLFGNDLLDWVSAMLAFGLAAPVAEEAFFRGYLFAALHGHFGLRKALWISAAVFAIAHLQPTLWPALLAYGLLFASLYEQTDSLWPSVALHCLINSVAVTVTFLLPLVRT
jgi:membrane protease YdiL (CAAX protease family)